ncbi:MAG: lipocalin family protein [Thiotrichales bacterium]
MPKSVQPVTGFDQDRYLGKWYEVVRLDHSFERGLSHVTAEYKLRDDGGISVLNRGFSDSENKWSEAMGMADFVNNSSEGYLKVSFFGPFYGSYVIFELYHEHYQYAFVSGPNAKYLWLLSRTHSVTPDVIAKFIDMSKTRGFDTDSLIYAKQN